MRPDLDDFDDISDTPEAPRSRAMSWMVLAVAVLGFAALAHYAYRSGTQSTAEGDMLVVQADSSPIKQVPADPEGEKFPNKDKTIYDVITPATGDQKVEKLLPEPERALAATDMEGTGDGDTQPMPSAQPPATTTYVNKNLDSKPAPAEAGTPVVSTPAPATAEDRSIAAPTMINEKPAAKKEISSVAPTDVKEVPVAGVKETKPVAPTKPAATKPAASAKTNAPGAYQVQLGAVKSEAEAQAMWKKITAKYGSIIKGSPIITQTPDGTLYRLRAGGFASADAAKAACAKLTAEKQACFPAGK